MQALYRKWRPQLWEEVVGQDHVVQTLRNALRTGRTAHAYLFAGPRGCGKTTTARLVAKALNCLHPDPAQRPDNTCAHCVAVNEGRFLDLIEIDGASNNSVENVRDLRDKINFAPSEGRYKIYIIDEVHMLSLGAFNALLKTLEEPPAHAVFILATTESYKIPPTVASRCQRFEFRRIPVAEIVARLKVQCAAEGLMVEEAALEMVARQATGSLRDAISLLDQLAASNTMVTLAQAQALLGASASQTVQRLVDSLASGDTAAALNLVNSAVDAGVDARQLARQVVDYLRNLMLVQMGNTALVEASAEVKATLARQAQSLEMLALLKAVRVFNTAASDVRAGWQPQLPLELAIVDCTTRSAAASAPAQSGEPAPAAAPRPTGAVKTSPPAALKTAAPQIEPEPAMPPAPAEPDAPVTPNLQEPPSAGASAPPTAASLKASWARLLSLMREKDKATEALLRSCTVAGLEGNILKLTTQVKLACEKINDHAQTRQAVTNLLTEVLGFPCNVQCTLVAGRGAAGGRSPSGGTRPQGGGSAKARDLPPSSLVATALHDLGGEIVEE
jgi:DNA polymerase-3 subunit gamma/tau